MGFADFFRKKSSSNVAKDRLKMVLVSDRANCSPDIMEQIKNDIIHVLSKYVEIDLYISDFFLFINPPAISVMDLFLSFLPFLL